MKKPMDKKERNRFIKGLLTALAASLISAFALHVFVYPSDFVPLGVEAIAAMLYKVYPKVNAGYFQLILNAPLIIFAWLKLGKKFVIYTMIFIIVSSVCLIIFEAASFPKYESGNRLLAAFFAGVLLGIRAGLMLKIGSSGGGADIIASYYQSKHPELHVERVISIICLAIMGLSYFVFKDVDSVLLSILVLFIDERAITLIMRDRRNAVKVEIITKTPDALREDIVVKLRHSATVINGKGMYSDNDYYIVVSIINLYQMADLLNILKGYKDAFVYYTEVQGVCGNFRWNKDDDVM